MFILIRKLFFKSKLPKRRQVYSVNILPQSLYNSEIKLVCGLYSSEVKSDQNIYSLEVKLDRSEIGPKYMVQK